MQHAPEAFFLGQRIISTVIVLYKDDVVVGLIIPIESKLIESSSHSMSDRVSKWLNFNINHTSLYFDIGRRRILDTRSQLSIQGIISSSLLPSPTLLPKKGSNDFTAIMAEFPTITQPCSKDRLIKHGIMHHIDTTGPSVSERPQRPAPEKLKIAQQEFEHMLELGIIQPLSSSWSSPLHMLV